MAVDIQLEPYIACMSFLHSLQLTH